MKISIKTFRLFSMAALALVMAACSSNDDMIQQQPAQPQGKKMHFTATIEAPNSTTRTVYTPDKDANNKDIIKVAWKEGDEIALIHGGVKDVVTIGTPNADGSAPISGDITVGANDETVVLAYPAAAVYSATHYGTFPFTPNPTCWDKAHAQDGTLEFIQNNIDFRMGSGKLSVSGDPATASLKESVKMPSMISIWKLTLQDNTSAALSATAVKVKANGELVAGATSTAKSAYYLCMVPSFIPEGDLVIEATVGSDTYTYTKAGGVSLTVGKFYQSTVTLTKPAPALIVSPAVGQVIGDDGKNYADAAAATSAGATAVAKIVYVGSDNGEAAPYNHGLALALSDANGGSSCKWKTSQADAGHTYKPNSSSFTSESGLQYNAMHNSEIDNYPAFKAAIANNGTAAPTGCSAWFLASGYQWKKMAGAAGLTNLGLTEGAAYWSSSERDASEAWVFLNGNWYNINKNTGFRVRACLAF